MPDRLHADVDAGLQGRDHRRGDRSAGQTAKDSARAAADELAAYARKKEAA
ncbi:hypothetical protein V1J52_06995 [Streptomyces sp. TRM 70351]|uniref:hypothetical protein n=1 Tax=Streptomyces sp. TRM 70351 TaxID=3116552 RepID=UPI002E7C2AD6|nr:hypothetical protein [Streptomyces sp. TRM 70351]MEE1927942.1 hypothetical protein [Streptomyces sp. TRM 70351]